jgi:protein-S-isoprenylcysteine O-methyltransferase Ste14
MNLDTNTTRNGGSHVHSTSAWPGRDKRNKETEGNMATFVCDPSPGSVAARVWYFLSRKRIHISLVVVCALIAEDMVRGQRPHAVVNFSDAWSTVGLFLVVAGILVRSWAAGVLKKNSVLSTIGPYALTRNPLYLGSFLMMIGFCTLIGALHNYVAMTLLAVLLYWPKIKVEEASLQGRFGQKWTDYARTTPRLLPRRLLAPGAWAGWSLAGWWHNKEYMALLGAALGLAVFETWFLLGR